MKAVRCPLGDSARWREVFIARAIRRKGGPVARWSRGENLIFIRYRPVGRLAFVDSYLERSGKGGPAGRTRQQGGIGGRRRERHSLLRTSIPSFDSGTIARSTAGDT